MARLDFPRSLAEFQPISGLPRPVAAISWPAAGRTAFVARAVATTAAIPWPWRPAAVPSVSAPDPVTAGTGPAPHPAAAAALVRRAYLVTTHTPAFSAVQLQAPTRARALRDGVDDAASSCAAPWCGRARTSFQARWSWTRACRWSGGRAARRPAARRAEVILAGAVEVRGHGSVRIRLAVVPDLSAATFARFAEEVITPAYCGLDRWLASFRSLCGSYSTHWPTVIGDP